MTLLINTRAALPGLVIRGQDALAPGLGALKSYEETVGESFIFQAWSRWIYVCDDEDDTERAQDIDI